MNIDGVRKRKYDGRQETSDSAYISLDIMENIRDREIFPKLFSRNLITNEKTISRIKTECFEFRDLINFARTNKKNHEIIMVYINKIHEKNKDLLLKEACLNGQNMKINGVLLLFLANRSSRKACFSWICNNWVENEIILKKDRLYEQLGWGISVRENSERDQKEIENIQKMLSMNDIECEQFSDILYEKITNTECLYKKYIDKTIIKSDYIDQDILICLKGIVIECMTKLIKNGFLKNAAAPFCNKFIEYVFQMPKKHRLSIGEDLLSFFIESLKLSLIDFRYIYDLKQVAYSISKTVYSSSPKDRPLVLDLIRCLKEKKLLLDNDLLKLNFVKELGLS